MTGDIEAFYKRIINHIFNFKLENYGKTDFEFRFGTVKVGYQEVETPVVYCKVLNGLENGYTFTNTTKVSGSYLEKYVEDNDEWTSVVYKKNIDLTKILPRTGM